MEESAPAALLFEILHPLGFNSVQVGDVFRSLSAQSGKRFVSAGWEVLRDRTELIIRRRKPADEEVEEMCPHSGLQWKRRNNAGLCHPQE